MGGITESDFSFMSHGSFGDETIRQEAKRNFEISQDRDIEGQGAPMIDRQKAINLLRGLYPNTSLLTPLLVKEMCNLLDKAGVTDQEFRVLLNKYRNDMKRMEDGGFSRCPNVRQLLTYYQSTRQAPTPPAEKPKHVPMPQWFREVAKYHRTKDVKCLEYLVECSDCTAATRFWARQNIDLLQAREAEAPGELEILEQPDEEEVKWEDL